MQDNKFLGPMIMIMILLVIAASAALASPVQETFIVNVTAPTNVITLTETALNDSSMSKNISFAQYNNNTVYVEILKNVNVSSAHFNVSGHWYWNYDNWNFSLVQGPCVLVGSDFAMNGSDFWTYNNSGDTDPYTYEICIYNSSGDYTGWFQTSKRWITDLQANGTVYWILESFGDRLYWYNMSHDLLGYLDPTPPMDEPSSSYYNGSWYLLKEGSYIYYFNETGDYVTYEDISDDSPGGAVSGNIYQTGNYFWFPDSYPNDIIFQYGLNLQYDGTEDFFVGNEMNTPVKAIGNGTYFWVGGNNKIYRYSKQYSTDPWIDVGNDSGIDWSYSGEFNQLNNRTSDLATELNDALNNGACDCNGCVINGEYCRIPITVNAPTTGKIEISDISITQLYNVTLLFSITSVSESITAGVDLNHTTQINSTGSALDTSVSISGYYLNYTGDDPVGCTINESSYSLLGSSGSKYCAISFNMTNGTTWINHTIFYTKGNKVTKTEIETILDTEFNSDIRATCSGYGTISNYYWNTTFSINNTDSTNHSNVFWNNNLEGATGGYAQSVLNGTISSIQNNSADNVTSRYMTTSATATENVIVDTTSAYEKDVTISPISGVDSAFITLNYRNVKINVSVNTDFTNYNLYLWNGIAWEKHTSTVGYNFSASGGYAYFQHNMSTTTTYYAISSETPVYDPPAETPTGGGGGGEPKVIIVSGNWSIMQPNFYLLAAPGSVTISYITIDNKENNEIEEIEAQCIPSTCREADPCTCVDLCKYVKFGEDLVYVQGKPYFQAYEIKPGQSGKLPFIIDFSENFAAENNLPSVQSCFYSFSIGITINEVTQPVSVTVVTLPGMTQIGQGLSWLQGQTLIIPGPYPVYLPNWLITILLIIGIIIIIVLIYRVLKKPKKKVIKWW